MKFNVESLRKLTSFKRLKRTKAERLQIAIDAQLAQNERMQALLDRKREEAELKRKLLAAEQEGRSIMSKLASHGVRRLRAKQVIIFAFVVFLLYGILKACS